jgi:PKD repeat protein
MKNIKLLNHFVLVIFFVGCSSDDNQDSSPMPVADFSYTNDGSTFSFNNLSENGSTYRWDFGDLSFTSNEENPIYTYNIGGEILVSLTVTNESGKVDYISKTISAPEIIIIDIIIDGSFDDWEDVEVAHENVSETGSIQKIKIWGGGPNINVYLEGNSKMQWPEGSGADIMFEGPPVSNGWGSFYNHIDPAGGWGWSPIAGSAAYLEASQIVNLSENINAIEFSIPKSQLGNLGETIGFAFTEMTAEWAFVANFPETTSFVTVEL